MLENETRIVKLSWNSVLVLYATGLTQLTIFFLLGEKYLDDTSQTLCGCVSFDAVLDSDENGIATSDSNDAVGPGENDLRQPDFYQDSASKDI